MLSYQVSALAALPDPADPVWRDWLTPAELAYCAGFRRVAEHLAVRALAKRAALRALRWPDPDLPWHDLPWHDLEVRRAPDQPPRLVLRGELAAWAAARGVPTPAVSLSHAGGSAAALAWLPGSASGPVVSAL